MLAKTARISNSADFAKATKSGLRSTSNSLVGYLYLSNSNDPARCGLIINKSVGNSVVRHSVARKIRHSIAANLSSLPTGSLFVIRALPAATSAELQNETTDLVLKLIKKAEQRSAVAS
jgi:ribonuclease P protein component